MSDQLDPATEKAIAALDAMAATWAAKFNLREGVTAMTRLPDGPDRLVRFVKHCYAEGLYEGRMSHRDHPAALQEHPDAAIACIAEKSKTASQPVAPTGWMAIESAPKGKKVIVGYWNKLSKWRTVMACYYLPQTLQMEDDRYDFDDDGYAPEGWYEECESQESILPTEETPVRWMPLPPLPAPECGVKGVV